VWNYELIQSKARLSGSERNELVRRLIATIGTEDEDD
jgi:hypothetical protein